MFSNLFHTFVFLHSWHTAGNCHLQTFSSARIIQLCISEGAAWTFTYTLQALSDIMQILPGKIGMLRDLKVKDLLTSGPVALNIC